jgi:hypothetical protein
MNSISRVKETRTDRESPPDPTENRPVRPGASVAAGYTGPEIAPDPQEVTMTTAQETIHWSQDVDKALEQARTRGKLVLVDFSAAPA